jgi:endonuclease/exonuclease/phosphatase family metal-dependent hydrolase
VSDSKLIRFAIAAAFFAAAIFFFAQNSVAQSNITLRVMTFNIHHAEGLDGQIDTQRIADLILQQSVDLVGLQEVDRGTARVSGRDLIAELAQKTGMTFVFSNNLSFQGGQYGNAILGKFPIRFKEHRLLPKVGSNEQRGWLKAVVDAHGKDVSFWVTHLASVADDTERLICATNFNNWLTGETNPVIFCGDFNTTPTSDVYALMTQKWKDTWLQAGQGNGYTIPVPIPTRRIDFIWTPPGSTLGAKSASVPFSQASDHFPVVTEITLTNFAARNFYFPFNEGSGSTIADSRNNLVGTLGANAPTWSSDSATRQSGDHSLYFDGTKRISVPDPNERIGTNGTNGNYTLQAWVKLPLNFSPAARMVLFQYERTPGFSFSINTNRTLHTTTFNVSDVPSTAALPNDGQWHHVAVVHTDGVDLKFFIDAALAASVNYTNGVGFRNSSTVTIGAAAGGANPFTGFLDRIRFDNRALTSAQLDFPSAISLGVRKAENAIVLFWPSAKTDYVLQTSSNLSSLAWSNVAFTVEGNENQTVVSPAGSTRFFRLKQ